MFFKLFSLIRYAGTIFAMAPEIIKKEEYNESIDIWSLGILMYEMFCGSDTHPFIPEEDKKKKMSQMEFQKHIEKCVLNNEPYFP